MSQGVGENHLRADMDALPSQALKKEALKEMIRLTRDPLRGDELDIHPMTGDLSDCRKALFDGNQYRIVYRLLPNAQYPQEIEIIAVGPRKDMKVYKVAAKRLGS